MSWYATIRVDRLRQLVSLNSETGAMTWRPRVLDDFVDSSNPGRAMRSWNTRFSGKPAFAHSTGNGYLHGGLFDRKILAHRVVWALHHGAWPGMTIDHIDGNKKNNRPSNLRDVTHRENCLNQPVSKVNSSGFTGVSFDKKRGMFESYVCLGGSKKTLGRFGSIADACSARVTANTTLGYHANHGRKPS